MKSRSLFLILLTIGWFAAAMAGTAYAQRTARATNRQIDNLLARIETNTDTFKRRMETSLDRSMVNNTAQEDRIMDFIRDFETATDELRRDSNGLRTAGNQVNEVMNRALYIDRFMARYPLNVTVQNQWRTIRNDLNTLSRYYYITWNWNRVPPGFPSGPIVPNRPPRATDQQINTLVRRIETRTDNFRQRVQNSLDRSLLNSTNREDRIMDFIRDFEAATDELSRNSNGYRTAGNLVDNVMNRALFIDRFMARNNLNRAAETNWINIRNDLNTLSNYYYITWDWNRNPNWDNTPGIPPIRGGRFEQRITGTYRLNRTLSDNVSTIVDRETVNVNTANRDRMRRGLERRLGSPEMLAIEVDNRNVSMASSLAPQVTFQADGVGRTETNSRGRTITTTATVDNNDLEISYVGERSNDFRVTFEPVGSDQLRVTRRIYQENRNNEIVVTSVYDKIDSVARWTQVNTGGPVGGPIGGATGEFIIPNGTQLTAELQNLVNTRDSQVGDRFTLRVTSPNNYRDAIIEGRITAVDNSGRLSGRANIGFDFDTIRMPNGRSYRFAGLIDSIRDTDGDNISVTNEGTVRDRNQTTTTLTRAGIGGLLGALIGAIAGGGEGAAIGAAVGAGAGAGSVLIQGRDNLDLEAGSTFNITATGPNNVGVVR